MRTMFEWGEITAAVGVFLGRERAAGRDAMTLCYAALGADEHAQRCVLAHYLADAQDDLDSEVHWDEIALAAYCNVAESDFVPAGIASAAGMAPSLHLNLGDAYRRQGRFDDAREQLDAGIVAAVHLGHDGYGSMIRGGLDRLRTRLEEHR